MFSTWSVSALNGLHSILWRQRDPPGTLVAICGCQSTPLWFKRHKRILRTSVCSCIIFCWRTSGTSEVVGLVEVKLFLAVFDSSGWHVLLAFFVFLFFVFEPHFSEESRFLKFVFQFCTLVLKFQRDVASSTTETKHSWFGSMKKITSISFHWKRAVMLAKYSIA